MDYKKSHQKVKNNGATMVTHISGNDEIEELCTRYKLSKTVEIFHPLSFSKSKMYIRFS